MMHLKILMAAAALALFTAACSQEPPEIKYGREDCAHCRMTVVDGKFGAAIRTVKGRDYVFDAAECMVPFVGNNGQVLDAEVAQWYVSDFAHPGTLIDATKAFYLHSPQLHSPMRGNVAAFATEAERKAAHEHFPGDDMDWPAVKKMFTEE